jgi:hypothetical protein
LKTEHEKTADTILAELEADAIKHHTSCYNKPAFTFERTKPQHVGVYAYAGDDNQPETCEIEVGIYVPRGDSLPQHADGWYAYIGPIPEIAKPAWSHLAQNKETQRYSSTTPNESNGPKVAVRIGVYHERPDGEIVYAYACTGGNTVMYWMSNYSEDGTANLAEYVTWKVRRDLKDWPNSTDPVLPYVFDLLYDIKRISQLESLWQRSGSSDRGELARLAASALKDCPALAKYVERIA